jgi:hypothetical protein
MNARKPLFSALLLAFIVLLSSCTVISQKPEKTLAGSGNALVLKGEGNALAEAVKVDGPWQIEWQSSSLLRLKIIYQDQGWPHPVTEMSLGAGGGKHVIPRGGTMVLSIETRGPYVLAITKAPPT